MHTYKWFHLTVLLLTGFAYSCAQCNVEPAMNTLTGNSLYLMPNGIETRWASPENQKGEKGLAGQANGGRKGRPTLLFRPDSSQTLIEVNGQSGMVRRIWMTISDRSPKTLRGMKLEMFWDGAEKPAASVPLGDFFGHGLGRMASFNSALFSSPDGRSFNCYIPMPFRSGMKITMTNQSDTQLALFYDIDYTLGDRHPDNMLYFHSHYRRENPTTIQKDYELLPKVLGKGRFIGVNIGMIANQKRYFKSWWGEGEVKIYLDGDTDLPTLCGTGTEDYIGTGWGQRQFDHLYQGCPVEDRKKMQYCFYRFHIPDSVYFYKDIRVTIQQIGGWNLEKKQQMIDLGDPVYLAGPGPKKINLADDPRPNGLFERQDDWSSPHFSPDRRRGKG